MCLFVLDMEGGRCFIRSTVWLVHAEKWPFLVTWSKFLQTGLNSVAWYHCASSGFFTDARSLSAACCFWIGEWYRFMVRLTYHMPDVIDQVPSNTVRPSFTKLR